MSNIKKREERREREMPCGRTRRRAAALRFVFALVLCSFAFAVSGCRQDMQDQPRYEYYEPTTFFKDGISSRPFVEGTVPRGYLREDAYFYTGQQAGQAGAQGTSGMTQPGERQSLTGSGAMQGGGDVLRRGNLAGGIPGGTGSETSPNPAAGGGGAASGTNADTAAMGGPDIFPFPVTEEVLRRGQERFNAYCAMCHGMTGEGDGMIVRRGFQRPPSFHDDRLQAGQAAAGHYFDVITNGFGAMPAYNYMISAEDRWKIITYIRALQMSRRATIDDVPPAERGKLSGGARPAGEQHGAGGEPPHGGEQH